jgi:hypothetical protein
MAGNRSARDAGNRAEKTEELEECKEAEAVAPGYPNGKEAVGEAGMVRKKLFHLSMSSAVQSCRANLSESHASSFF